MAITLRSTKGSPLTHTELDNNFREFYYSSSIEGSAVIFHRYTAISSSVSFPVNPPNGKDQYIQIKLGNAVSGSQAVFTGSADFRFDYQNSHLKVTGSHTHVGTSIISGSQTITGGQIIGGNLVVGGTVTAEEFITERVATSYVYKSGSTKFGDSSDDNHAFTGSLELNGRLEVVGPTTQSGDIVLTGNTVTTGDYTITGDITQSGNFDITGNTLHTGTTSTVGTTNLSGTNTISGSNTIVGGTSIGSINSGRTLIYGTTEYNAGYTHFRAPNLVNFESTPIFEVGLEATGSVDIAGNLTVTGRVTAQEFHTELVSSSIVYESGSTKFGDSIDDTHQFTGSVNINGVLSIPGFSSVSSSLAALESADVPAIVINSGLPVFASGITKAETLTLLNVEDGATATNVPAIYDNSGTPALETGITAAEVRTLLDVDQAGTDNSTDVTLAGTYDYITILGQTITRNQITNADLENSTISGVALGSNLENLTVGTGISFDGGAGYNGGTARQISIGQSVATDANVTFNKVTAAAGASNGFTFPLNPGGGTSDEAKIVYYASTGENTVLELAVTNDADDNIYLNASGGTDVANDLRVTGNVTAYYSSDERQKDNIKNISQPIEKIKQIGGYEFDWNENSNLEGHDVGVIAQEIEKVLPEVVTTRDNGYKAVRYEKIVALLIEAVKEQQSQIEELKSRL